MVSDKGFGMQRMVREECFREVIKIWFEFLDGKDQFKYSNGGVWEMIDGDPRLKQRQGGENRMDFHLKIGMNLYCF